MRRYPMLADDAMYGSLIHKWEYLFAYAGAGFAKGYITCHMLTFVRAVRSHCARALASPSSSHWTDSSLGRPVSSFCAERCHGCVRLMSAARMAAEMNYAARAVALAVGPDPNETRIQHRGN